MNTPALEVSNLHKYFSVHRGILRREIAQIRAVAGVTFSVARGETLCLVGESGCGKSTVAKLVMRLSKPTAGTIRLDGKDVTNLDEGEMRKHRRHVQMVFQDPYASLNPKITASTIVGEPIENFERLSASEREERVAVILQKVGLRSDAMRRYPFEFSGGQRQRLAIARALAVNPGLIVADEPVSALDVSVQAQVLNLLMDLQDEFKLAYLFISHDLGVVEHIGHRIAVMYLGGIVETAHKEAIFGEPLHPYTEALIDSAPIADPRVKRERLLIEGDVPSPMNPPSGCHFHTRCPYVTLRCRREDPQLREVVPDHFVACHLREDGYRGPLPRPA
ncbi:ABC transporter ATP-binding protein [Bradyrhizobium canariense]|uniref:ABC transporter ATP-binding protein n=1 Tax=Bradyrhizobium TaxID=374 RepID=UPI000A1970D4|nr:dipeptide ABC transporter ATP-binding protein [Bradyrhizobium canariense]OSI30547.1 peptide ABC transporter substrate-binding protein [Bradyrhizobium canariense]OSI37308.1 peptide ABC transporter substrate-binding protein [Bradyrhizobium canariense]OSI52028.1 peptide ABC transporter substrate-binding protein [Bradyrhizobium canariense]OSI56331.1 peptide ABC transporter substrate-binding protein [Bradyrhizobium canariense]OSI59403.1 peptide ABC transporter substrate-binding protein [Bradyrhi